MAITVRRGCDAADWAAIVAVDERAFGYHATEERRAELPELFDLTRFSLASDGTETVGVAGSYAFSLSVTGGRTVAASGLTWVGVQPTHRRRGVMRLLVSDQEKLARERGEPVVMLLASEAPIYARFGFGPATFQRTAVIDVRRTELRTDAPVGGRVRYADAAAELSVFADVFERSRLLRPCEPNRSDAWWERFGRDPEHMRDGHGARFELVHLDDTGAAQGYACYRVELSWPDSMPANVVHIVDMAHCTPQAHATLWRQLLSLDLVGEIRTKLSLDDPLPWLVTNRRAVKTHGLADGVHVALIDIPAALQGRRYCAPDCLTLAVTGVGRYQLDVTAGEGRCHVSTHPPDIELGLPELGSLWLGGVHPGVLRRAGRLTEHTAGAVTRLGALFASDPLPFCSTFF